MRNTPTIRERFNEKQRILFGPFGTQLKHVAENQDDPGILAPRALLSHPLCKETIRRVSGAYVAAGATVATTNTFSAREFLHENGGDVIFKEYIQEAVALLRAGIAEASNRADILEVISLGPQGDCYDPTKGAPTSVNEAKDFHESQVKPLRGLDIDAVWFETFPTSLEAAGAAYAAQLMNVPCVINFSIDKNGYLRSGESPNEAIRHVDRTTSALPPLGYGFNCCDFEAVERALKKCDPSTLHRVIAAYPNAVIDGHLLDGTSGVHTVEDSERMARKLASLAHRYDLKVIGGCCGFNESDIAALRKHLDQSQEQKAGC